MTDFTLFDAQTAPEEAKPLLDNSVKAFGMIPNLHAVMAASPQLLEGYQKLHQLAQETTFNKEELTVVWQSINVEHGCHYCVPAHTAIANMMGVNEQITESLRNEQPLTDAKLETLRQTTLAVVRNRGIVSNSELDSFFSAGYTNQQLLEIILVLAQKVMSNYVNHVADTPVDQPFQKFAWSK